MQINIEISTDSTGLAVEAVKEVARQMEGGYVSGDLRTEGIEFGGWSLTRD